MITIEDILKKFREGHDEFDNGHLECFDVSEPFDLFQSWTKEAVEIGELEANAFILSTVDRENQPSSRILYLKELIDGKLVFYTNYNSKKGQDIEINTKVSMLFFWPQSSRQIRVQGECTKVASTVSDDYFASRPRGSQIGAWASHQSETLTTRDELEDRVKEYEAKFEGEVPRPPHWGGYEVKPTRFEFWQGRPSRLHDRIVFSEENGIWMLERLNP